MNKDANNVLDLEALRRGCRNCSVNELCLPAPLHGDDLDRLSKILDSSAYVPGRHVFNIGDRCRSLYVIQKGSLKSWVTSSHGHMQVLGFHLPGEIIGLDGLDSLHHQSTVEPLEYSVLCRLPYVDLENIVSQVPGLHRQLLRVISREFVIEHEHVMMMSSRPAIERVALFVQVLAQRRTLRGHPPRLLELSMSRSDLASYLALASETVSRMLTTLQTRKIIRLSHRKLEILDPHGLAEVSGEDLGSISLAD